jgi:hypothetical protein
MLPRGLDASELEIGVVGERKTVRCGISYARRGSDSTVKGWEICGCIIQKFPDWPPRTRTINGTALCH